MENLQKVISNLKAQLAELEKIAAGEVEVESARIWPLSIDDLPNCEPIWWVCNTDVFPATASSDFREYPTEAAALSAAAFSQLSRMVHHINGGDVYKGEIDAAFEWSGVYLDIDTLRPMCNNRYTAIPNCLYFKNEADRDRSMVDHRALWLQYFTGKKQENNEQ